MAAATMYATVAGAGSKNGADWDNAFDAAALIADITNNAEAGDIYYVLSGTYPLAANLVTTRAGLATAYVSLIGVSDTSLTPATGDDRPLFDGGSSYYSSFNASYWRRQNVRFSANRNDVAYFVGGSFSCDSNVKATNPNAGANAVACKLLANNNAFIACEFSGPTAGYAFHNNAVYVALHGCSLHTAKYGTTGSHYSNYTSCLFRNLSDTGLNLVAYYRNQVIGCTFYGCGKAIAATTAYGSTFLNNIIAGCTVGANWDADQNNCWDYNNWHGNGTADVVNVTKGPHDTAIDPSFVDAANGDFRVGAALIGAGFPGAMPGTAFSAPAVPGALQIVAPVLPATSVVVEPTAFGYRSALAGTHPTEATSKAAQLATDIAEVNTHTEEILATKVVLTGSNAGTASPRRPALAGGLA